MKFRGALFDYDGTLTPRYVNQIPNDLISKTCELTEHGIMLGLCTARSFKSALPRMEIFFVASKNPAAVRKNWVLICENGSKGYVFNEKTSNYDEFYSAQWPKEINREKLFHTLCEEFDYDSHVLNNDVSLEVFQSEVADNEALESTKTPNIEKNDVSLILRPDGRENMTYKQWEDSSKNLYNRISKILEKFDPNGLLHVGDSKMGVSILPANGDKDRGIKEFAKLISVRSGREIAYPFKEIIAIGDQADESGNDYHFLKGEVGTTFTVGAEISKNSNARKVCDRDGNILIGPEGTLHVLNSNEFVC